MSREKGTAAPLRRYLGIGDRSPVISICRRRWAAIGITTVLVELLLIGRTGADTALPAFLVFGAVGVVWPRSTSLRPAPTGPPGLADVLG